MKDNVTGKDKEFYELGKRMFDRLNPPGTPEFKPYFPKREWVGLTTEEALSCMHKSWQATWNAIELMLKEKNT